MIFWVLFYMNKNFLGRKCSKFVGSFGAVETFYDDNYQAETSILYSKDKKKWIYGPNLPKELNFKYASGVALNRTVVLFVGVGFLGSSICNLRGRSSMKLKKKLSD